jgi:RND superfamily putative drug exporter
MTVEERRHRLRWLLPALAIVAFLLVGGPLGSLAGKVAEVQKNDSAEYLPASAEATKVQELTKRFAGKDTMATVVVYRRAGGLTRADQQKIAGDLRAINDRLGGKLAAPPIGPVPSDDKQAAQVIVQFAGSDAQKLKADIDWVRQRVSGTPSLEAHVGGPGGILADLMKVFDAINGMLLLATAGIVLFILVVVYRSPILPLVVLGVAGISLGISNGLVYLLAKNNVLTVSGQTQAILDVLVIGAGTDYALLLVSRFREELRRHQSRYDAIRTAWRASVEPIVASASTVILGLLCMLISDLKSNQGLGPVAALGIACALVCMLFLLPAILALFGRVAFWPFRPMYGTPPAEEHGVWARVARLVSRRPRMVWITTALILGLFTLGLFRLDADGIPQTQQFINNPDSKVAQDLVGKHFPAGSGSPAIVIAKADHLKDVVDAAGSVPGVAQAVPYAPTPPPAATPPIATPLPKIVDGMVRVDVTLAVVADSPKANEVIRDLRAKLHALRGADAQVGGYTAINLDVQETAQRDRDVIIPLVLAVVFVVLMLLLRAVVAPLLLILTVILSFFATLGVSGVVFKDLFDFAGADSSYPLFAFVFLVALGVDYNIFLMTRVREEAARRGHGAGTLAGLSVTGGVITSAGVVLAATFAALSVLPLVFVAEIAFAVAFGVLLDTLVVRSLLVPALTVDVGRFVWWPGRLRRTSATPAEAPVEERELVSQSR